MCTRCEREHTVHQPCPTICHECRKRGHFQAVCRSRLVNLYTEYPIRGSISWHSTAKYWLHDKWEETLFVNGTPIEVKIDTGADVSVISESTIKQPQRVSLQPAAVPLNGARQQTLSVCGKFKGTLTHKTNVIKDEIFVVQKLQKALLGKPAKLQ